METVIAERPDRLRALEGRLVELDSEAERLAEATARALAEGDEAAWDQARGARNRVLDERGDTARAIEALREQVADAERDRLTEDARRHVAHLTKQAGGLRGEVPRAFERAVEALKDAAERFEKAAGLFHELEHVAEEARALAEACGIEPPVIETLDYGTHARPWQEVEYQSVRPAAVRHQRSPARPAGDETAALLDRAAALRPVEAGEE